MGSASSSEQTLLGQIVAGDIDAAAAFYDGRAPSVREYFLKLCNPEVVDEATLAAFIDFRGRAATVPPDADLDDLLRRAARAAAAGRLDLGYTRAAECRAVGELLIARMNGELIRNEEPFQRHLGRCVTCRRTAELLSDSDSALNGAGGEPPSDHVRVAWLELVGREDFPEREGIAVPADATATGESWAPSERVASAAGGRERPEPQPPAAAPQPPAAAPDPEPPAQPEPRPLARVRARRGGLVGAARRLASSTQRHQ